MQHGREEKGMTNNTEEILSILNTGYTVCLVLALAFFLLSVVLFFLFDIRHVYMIKSGKAAKRDIRKLEETNFQTGQLSQYSNMDMGGYTTTGNLTPSEDLYPTAPMEQLSAASSVPAAPDANGTTLLNAGETTVLNTGAVPVQSYYFKIIKKELHIHTTEYI